MQRQGFAGNLTLAGGGGDSRDSLGSSGLARALRRLEGWGSEAGELDSFQAAGGTRDSQRTHKWERGCSALAGRLGTLKA